MDWTGSKTSATDAPLHPRPAGSQRSSPKEPGFVKEDSDCASLLPFPVQGSKTLRLFQAERVSLAPCQL